MSEQGRTLGLGLALVDEKIGYRKVSLPKKETLISFLDSEPDKKTVPGGVTPNIITTYALFSPHKEVRLLGCVGDDSRGEFYQKQTDSRLGNLQIHSTKPTGVVASMIDERGRVVERERFYAAAETVTAEKEELTERNTLFISDIFSVRLPHLFEEAEAILQSIQKENGVFFLNLGGFTPAIDTRDQLLSVANALKKPPDIVMGNDSEVAYATNGKTPLEAMDIVFPKSRLVVITQGKYGSLVRFEGEKLIIPSFKIPENALVDETGAGDCYAGVMLAALYTKSPNQWIKEHVLRATRTASYAASLVIQQANSRLSQPDAQRTIEFFLQS